MTYAQPIFTPGRRYRVLQTFASGPTTTFITNDVLVFERDAYSHYDNSFVYVFRSESSGTTKEWWLSDGEPKEEWQTYFEEL